MDAGQRGHVEDRAAAMIDHAGEKGAGHMEKPAHVDGEHAL
jgi:hypothetical protein